MDVQQLHVLSSALAHFEISHLVDVLPLKLHGKFLSHTSLSNVPKRSVMLFFFTAKHYS